jgi:hypothetical protein
LSSNPLALRYAIPKCFTPPSYALQGYKRAANVYKAKNLWANAIKVLEAALKRCKGEDAKGLESSLAELKETMTVSEVVETTWF